MSNLYELHAESRAQCGTRHARRLRKEAQVPGIVYGAGKEAHHITLSHKDVALLLQNEAAYSHILTLKIDGKLEKVVLKSLDRHPFRPLLLHVDFQRINEKEKLTRHIPLHFHGEDKAPGMKADGVLSKQMNEIEIRCLPADLPEHIDVDVSKLGLEESLHLSDIVLPKGVELTVPLDEVHNHPVVSIHKPRVVVEEETPTVITTIITGQASEAVEPEEGSK